MTTQKQSWAFGSLHSSIFTRLGWSMPLRRFASLLSLRLSFGCILPPPACSTLMATGRFASPWAVSSCPLITAPRDPTCRNVSALYCFHMSPGRSSCCALSPAEMLRQPSLRRLLIGVGCADTKSASLSCFCSLLIISACEGGVGCTGVFSLGGGGCGGVDFMEATPGVRRKERVERLRARCAEVSLESWCPCSTCSISSGFLPTTSRALRLRMLLLYLESILTSFTSHQLSCLSFQSLGSHESMFWITLNRSVSLTLSLACLTVTVYRVSWVSIRGVPYIDPLVVSKRSPSGSGWLIVKEGFSPMLMRSGVKTMRLPVMSIPPSMTESGYLILLGFAVRFSQASKRFIMNLLTRLR
mmetsp:Transcript_64899/g.159782  ORF Transcript_64899/g.159782 Transcript_64899/m.159782 type:complete len:357 (-) Transcript_64899:3079-4149(-)